MALEPIPSVPVVSPCDRRHFTAVLLVPGLMAHKDGMFGGRVFTAVGALGRHHD